MTLFCSKHCPNPSESICSFNFLTSAFIDYDVDGGRDLDIFDINEGMQTGDNGGKKKTKSAISLFCNSCFLFVVSTEAGLNLVEGDIVLDEVCSFNCLLYH